MVSGIPRNNVSTKKDEWQTPPKLFKRLDEEYHFEVDAACSLDNRLCTFGITKEMNALSLDWHKLEVAKGRQAKRFFLNPPYGRGVIDKFVAKAYWESRSGVTTVCLIPFNGSGWFRNYCLHAETIDILGRVKYIGYDLNGKLIDEAPTFDSCVVVFSPGYHKVELRSFVW